MTVRTRFAPSPTGRLHLGNVRAAVFNWLFARRHEGAFVVRIEDTDVDRNVEGAEEAILEDLRWMGLSWDEGPDVGGPHAPYRQSGRAAHYDSAVTKLLEEGSAYPCYCSDAQLALDMAVGADGREILRYAGRCRDLGVEDRRAREDAGAVPLVRFRVPRDADSIDIIDEVYGPISFPINDIDDFVIRRSDGRTTYNFGVVVDDIDMEISHVIRGAGHLSNTPKQALLFDAFGHERPRFAHLPTVLGHEGGKLSKRAGAAAVADLRAQGYPPAAVLNYVSLLGWSHPEEREVLTRDELIASASLDRVGRSDPRMDPEKLVWMAAQHVAGETLDELAAHVGPFVDRQRYPMTDRSLALTVEALRSRLSTYGGINDHLSLLHTTNRLVRTVGKEVGARGPALFHPVRIALTGSEQGPDLGKVLAALGKDETIRRLDLTLDQSGV
jgi:nondiscriminating glutamyl-tRNA synthetase